MNTKLTKEYNDESKDRVKMICKSHQISIGFGWVKAAGKSGKPLYNN